MLKQDTVAKIVNKCNNCPDISTEVWIKADEKSGDHAPHVSIFQPVLDTLTPMTQTPETGAINPLHLLALVFSTGFSYRTIYVWNEYFWRKNERGCMNNYK